DAEESAGGVDSGHEGMRRAPPRLEYGLHGMAVDVQGAHHEIEPLLLEEDGIAGEDLHAVDGPPHPHRNPDLPSPRADDDLGVPGRAALHPPSRIHAGDLGFEGLVVELRV